MQLWPVAVGIALLALGAIGATLVQRQLEQTRRGRWVVPALVPFGVLVGAGAALVRGWTLGPAMVAGALILPLVAVVARLVEVRRRQ